ncbi:glucosamine-6-phosphate deaminase [Parabacteroides sp.]
MKIDNLSIYIFPDRQAMGRQAATDVSVAIRELLERKAEIGMIFAAAPSQNEFLAALTADPSIPWGRVNAFHMDEYIGLSPDAPQGFGNFLKERLFDRVSFRNVYYIPNDATDPAAAIAGYSRLLAGKGVDIVCMGIGENGHIAFNDPHVADFADPVPMKVVELDPRCRRQQVNDGCFSTLAEVPERAFTLTIPVLMSAPYTFCIVPARSKAEAVYNTLYAAVSERNPSTILRRKENARLYLDAGSASLLPEDRAGE